MKTIEAMEVLKRNEWNVRRTKANTPGGQTRYVATSTIHSGRMMILNLRELRILAKSFENMEIGRSVSEFRKRVQAVL